MDRFDDYVGSLLKNHLFLANGACHTCRQCAWPDQPCRFPDRLHHSIEGYGLNILIDHGNGYQTRYSHCNSLLVAAGDEVSQGQVIATMGATGRVTGVHLDFRVYLDGAAINPLSVLDPPED